MIKSIQEDYNKLSQALSEQNIRFRMVPVERLAELKAGITDTLDNKMEDEDFAAYVRRIFKFNALDNFPSAKSILVASVYNPAGKVIFKTKDRDIEAIIPQGFIKFYPKQRVLQQKVTETLSALGYRTERILLPIKLLAVRSGLAEYGKNNITYVNGFGSAHFLGAFITDLPAQDDFWREPKVMDSCEACNLCRSNCPTGAIGEDRFLLHGEKCITLYNENPGEFPDWIDKKWHHAVIGCIKCQSVCPHNIEAYKQVPILETFTVAETETLLSTEDFEQLPDEVKLKFEQFGFPEYHHVLLRNIRALCF